MDLARQKLTAIIFSVVIGSAVMVSSAQAGWMDKLNQATQKLNEKTQQMQQRRSSPPAGEDPDRPLHLEDHYKGSCEGKRSATCMDYMEIAGQCMDPLNGYRAKLYVDRIEKKLKTEELSADLRKNLEEDLAGFREAYKNKTDTPTIAGQANSQRYLEHVSEEDQIWVNAEHTKFYNKIYNKCMGADHMGIGKRTEMNVEKGISGDEAVAQYQKERAKAKDPSECMKGMPAVRYVIMAEMMEAKMKKLNPSGAEKSLWEEDIAAVKKTAAEGGTTMPQSNDPANPFRAMTRLSSSEEMMELNTKFSTESQRFLKECMDAGEQPAQNTAQQPKKGLVDHSQSPANKNAKKHTEKKYADLNYGRGGSTNLLALRRDKGCADQLKGNIPRLTAEMLEEKLKSGSGVCAQKRQECEEDIAAFRAAAEAGVDSPEPPDPDNPYRWYDYVTNQERAQVNKKHADLTAKVMRECNSKPSGL